MHGLTEAIGAVQYCEIVAPPLATRDDLLAFHDHDFVTALESAANDKVGEMT